MKIIFTKKMLVLGILFFISSRIFGQVTLEGIVVDSLTQEPLIGASVFITGTTQGDATNLNGEYKIHNIPEGNYKLRVSYVGYDTKTIDIALKGNRTIELFVQMATGKIYGKTIEVTAQAQGQQAAIQQQLTSDKIVNIISEQRIQQLPDFNAAAAIGRLPGVSTLASSGEANKIVIRGLAPQFNQVTIGGMSMASTGSAQIGASSQMTTSGQINNDRSVDLSTMSPYMIKSIAVYKSLTPDMNANSLGGTVNMELREAPAELHTDLLWQSGYTAKSKTYGNYRGVASVSTRFFDDAFGVYVLGNIESYDRNADNMNADYFVTDSKAIGSNGYLPVRVRTVTLNRHTETRKRYGGNLILDYKLPSGSIKLINMLSRLNSDYQDYQTTKDYQSGDLGFSYRAGENDVDAMINSLSLTNDFGFMSIDLKAANTYSRNNLPYSPQYQFTQTQGVGTSTVNTTPEDLTYLVNYAGTASTYLTRMSLYSSDYKENGQAYKADFKIPFNLGSGLSGYFKAGGEYQYKTHKNAQTTPYADIIGTSSIANRLITGIRTHFPELLFDGSASKFPGTSFTSTDNDLTESFLDNRFGSTLWVINPNTLGNIINFVSSNNLYSADSSTAQNSGGWFNGLYQTLPNSYKYIEKYYSTFLMAELDFGNLMIVGGVRYEEVRSLFNAYNLKDGRSPRTQTADTVTVYPKNNFLLPMVQAKYNVVEWLDVRYSYTQTLARPDYHQLSPHFNMAFDRGTVWAGNPNLKPAHSYNHDIIFTIHNNEIGLLSIGGFYKTIKNFTYATQYTLHANGSPGLDSVGSFSVQGVSPKDPAQLYTYMNTPYDATVKGIEVDFQTRLWYLPAPFDGIVFGINYTHIKSEATYPWRDDRTIYRPRPLPAITYVLDSTRTGRLINQPNDILNSYIGYDYKGFSSRISFIFQGNSVSYVGNFEERDGFSKDYFRIDASVRQILPWYGIEVYLDMNNLNSESNQSAQKSISGFTNEQNYGLTMNLGIRYRL